MNRKILFVDHEPAALNCYRQMLESKFAIATAGSGEEGLVSLRDHGPFAVVISDMQMTGMDGVQFLKRVRQVAPSTIRLLLTRSLDLNGAVNAVNEGCVFRLLIKPCEDSLLTWLSPSASTRRNRLRGLGIGGISTHRGTQVWCWRFPIWR